MPTRCVLVAICLGARLAAQAGAPSGVEHKPTPPQPFFAWSRLDFAREEYQARRAAMLQRLKVLGGGVMLVPSAHGLSHGDTFRQHDDFLYFTGLELPQSMLVLDADTGCATLFVPPTDRRFESPARRNDFPGRTLLGDRAIAEATGIERLRSFSEFDGELAELVAHGHALLVDPGTARLPELPVGPIRDAGPIDDLRAHILAQHPAADVRSAFVAVAELRMVKSPAELALLRRACKVTCDAIVEAAAAVQDGVDERTLEGVLELGFKRGGSQRRAFDSIIKSGPNSLWPWRILAAHYDRRNRVMHAGELVIFDVGCELDHYATDVGRTFPVGGTFTERQREILEMATGVADAIIAKARPGVTLTDLMKVAYEVIPAEHRRYMQTGSFFGHHIGLATGDPTLFGAPLLPGMVFTVEPWYYNHDEQIAVFVEDMIVITEQGCENLSAGLPRTADELERLVERPR